MSNGLRCVFRLIGVWRDWFRLVGVDGWGSTFHVVKPRRGDTVKIRSIRPEFFADPTMAELSHAARLLYIGLWCLVDDDGRGEWLPKQIDGQIFPLEDVDIHALLEQLVRTARIVRYTDGDREYFHIPTFVEYQRPNRKYDSKLPDPAKCQVVEPNQGETLPTQRGRTADAHAGEGEGEGEGVVEVVSSSPNGGRPRNAHFEAAAAALDMPTRGSHEGLLGAIAAKAAKGGHPPDEILRRAALHLATFDFPLTPGSLNKRWDELGSKVVTASKAERRRVQEELERMRERERILLAMGET